MEYCSIFLTFAYHQKHHYDNVKHLSTNKIYSISENLLILLDYSPFKSHFFYRIFPGEVLARIGNNPVIEHLVCILLPKKVSTKHVLHFKNCCKDNSYCSMEH